MVSQSSINGIPLDCETVADSFEKSLTVQEFPYSDRPRVEDLGQKARSVHVKAWFTGDRYADHLDLLDLITVKKPVIFEHPNYGELSGYVRTVSVSHDESPDTAVCEFDFVAESYNPAVLVPFRDVALDVETAVKAGLEKSVDNFTSALKNALNEEAAKVLDASVDPALPVAPQIQGTDSKARLLVKRISTAVARAEAAMIEASIPASSLIAHIEFSEDLPGRVVGAFAKAAERYVTTLSSIAEAADRLLRSLSDYLCDLKAEIFPDGDDGNGLYQAFLASTGLVAALAAANSFDADQEKRNVNAALSAAESFDAAGNFIKTESPAEVLNAPRIEKALALARTLLAEALTADRANRPLADAAAALLAHVSAVKLEIENLTTVVVMQELPLFLVLLANGLSYQDADRVMAVNQAIVNPSFTSGEVQIYVR